MLSLSCMADEDPVFELPLELPYEMSSDEMDFPRDENLRIVEPPPIPKELDHPVLRRTGHSLIPWSDLKETEFLNVKRWIAERAERDKDPLWKIKHRLSSSREQVGKVIGCVGTCTSFRGTASTKIGWLSRILEGDEINTDTDSYLWMMLTDGALVRLSPETSIGFLEMNVTKEKFFFHARVNKGHIYWRPRRGNELLETQMAETDRLFLPVMDPKANVEWFGRKKIEGKSEQEKNLLSTSIEIQGKKEQYSLINELIKKNNQFATVAHEALIVAPNVNALVQNGPFSLFYAPGGKSYVKSWTGDRGETGKPVFSDGGASLVRLFYRGFENTDFVDIEQDKWTEVDADGKDISVMDETPGLLLASEILFQRIPTIILVREKWLKETKGIWDSIQNPEKLATDWGLRLWNKEQDTRLSFLTEYTRRVETTNLRVLRRLTELKPTEFDDRYISRAMSKYLVDLKQRYSFSNTSVLDMSPLHYYGWVLINAKK